MEHYGHPAQNMGVGMLCIGSEFVQITGPRYSNFWKALIKRIRVVYSGSLIYGRNWAGEEHITFWTKLDYIGIDAYYKLTGKKKPSQDQLIAAWHRWLPEIEALNEKWRKPVIFTGIGYRGMNGSNSAPWSWESEGKCDLQEQADCYRAAFTVFWDRPWFKGMYWRYWIPDPDAGGPGDTNYTPQNKPAQGGCGFYMVWGSWIGPAT